MRLLDTYGRVIKDVRISVTPRCNLHCLYCHPLGLEVAEPPGTLTVEEVDHFLEAASLLGLSAVRFTGGEPLVRKELPQMIARAREKEGIEDVAITTNGLLFAKRAKELVEAGLNRVNISLDAITPEVFTRITRGGKVERVVEAMETALELDLHPVKLNAVVIRGMNEEEVVPLAGLSLERPLHMRFIEYMHLDNSDPEEYRRRFVPGKETRARIEAVYGPLEPVPTTPPPRPGSFASRQPGNGGLHQPGHRALLLPLLPASPHLGPEAEALPPHRFGNGHRLGLRRRGAGGGPGGRHPDRHKAKARLRQHPAHPAQAGHAGDRRIAWKVARMTRRAPRRPEGPSLSPRTRKAKRVAQTAPGCRGWPPGARARASAPRFGARW
jgi:cyclic pyranopterin phosphate synthase